MQPAENWLAMVVVTASEVEVLPAKPVDDLARLAAWCLANACANTKAELAALDPRRPRIRQSRHSRSRSQTAGIAVAIETKTRTYDGHHVARVRSQAAWLLRRRRRWCRAGALAVLCVARGRGVARVEDEVLVVSLDRLVPVLRAAAGTCHPRPAVVARGLSRPAA